MIRRSQIPTAVLALMFFFGTAGCRQSSGPTQGRILSPSELTPQERKYGRGPKPDRSVSYQKDVIIPEGGADIIRNGGTDGITWTIDANARHVSEISVGKIVFVTGRCVGRVLQVERAGSDLKLILGPVELTDIFEKLDVAITQQPVDFSNALRYPPEQFPTIEYPTEVPETEDDWASIRPYRPRSRAAALQSGPQVGLVPVPLRTDQTLTKSLNNADGVGMELHGDAKGLRAVAQVQLRIAKPTVDAHISIDHGKVEASVLFHNAAGLRLAFETAVNQEFPGRLRWRQPAGQFSFPIGTAVPISLDIRQELIVQAAFASRTSSFNGVGQYDFNADIGFTLHNGSWNLVGPKGVTIKQDLMQSYSGVSVAPRELTFYHIVTLTAGLGGAGFTIGPQASLESIVDAKKGSDVALVECRGATLQMGLKAGVGWTMPRVVASFVNQLLTLIHVAPIADHGGPSSGWKLLFVKKVQTPTSVCGGSQS